MRWWLAPIILALLVGSGCGTSSSESPPLARIPLSAVTTPVTGGTPAQRRIARAVLAGLGRPQLRFVRLETPEKRMRPFSKGDVVITAIGQPNDHQAPWKAWLFAADPRPRRHQSSSPSQFQQSATRHLKEPDVAGKKRPKAQAEKKAPAKPKRPKKTSRGK